jgi:hypothetical protein
MSRVVRDGPGKKATLGKVLESAQRNNQEVVLIRRRYHLGFMIFMVTGPGTIDISTLYLDDHRGPADDWRAICMLSELMTELARQIPLHRVVFAWASTPTRSLLSRYFRVDDRGSRYPWSTVDYIGNPDGTWRLAVNKF